jgi:hypothetical protein
MTLAQMRRPARSRWPAQAALLPVPAQLSVR